MWSDLYNFKNQEFRVFEDFFDCYALFLLLHTISICQKYKQRYLHVCYDFISLLHNSSPCVQSIKLSNISEKSNVICMYLLLPIHNNLLSNGEYIIGLNFGKL